MRCAEPCLLWSPPDEKVGGEDDDWNNLLIFLFVYSLGRYCSRVGWGDFDIMYIVQVHE